ncbi:hypothetical protein P691DRAFT_400326 [Macrolepiota fuliginosa MF-IS2]|uniref:Uncharacterized protein n=1 Tax=Macrolepiota fuliginosa MF-IS2 TaxID=1400762 RepID=A0A9P5XHT6_9AGAR|nr:hypothetical protein P691DRAFT_400326 [Macrolepiota fuliginosa MF-IS2]
MGPTLKVRGPCCLVKLSHTRHRQNPGLAQCWAFAPRSHSVGGRSHTEKTRWEVHGRVVCPGSSGMRRTLLNLRTGSGSAKYRRQIQVSDVFVYRHEYHLVGNGMWIVVGNVEPIWQTLTSETEREAIVMLMMGFLNGGSACFETKWGDEMRQISVHMPMLDAELEWRDHYE